MMQCCDTTNSDECGQQPEQCCNTANDEVTETNTVQVDECGDDTTNDEPPPKAKAKSTKAKKSKAKVHPVQSGDEDGDNDTHTVDDDLPKVKKASKHKKAKITKDEEYRGNAGFDEMEVANETKAKKSKKSASKETEDGVPKPKRVKNSYFWYADATRGTVMSENGIKDVKEVSKILGARWKGMDAEQKAPYVKMYQDAKAAQAMEAQA